MQYNAIQRNAIACNTMQYNVMQCNTMQYYAMQYNAIQCNTMQYNATQCHLGSSHAIQCNTMQCKHNMLLITTTSARRNFVSFRLISSLSSLSSHFDHTVLLLTDFVSSRLISSHLASSRLSRPTHCCHDRKYRCKSAAACWRVRRTALAFSPFTSSRQARLTWLRSISSDSVRTK